MGFKVIRRAQRKPIGSTAPEAVAESVGVGAIENAGGAPFQASRPRIERERGMQVSLFKWAKLAQGGTPELALLFAVPNGGHRLPSVAKKMMAEGVKAGVPDLFLPVARDGYHGLWLELKCGKNTPSDKQHTWIAALQAQGYWVSVIYDDWLRAKTVIEEYLQQPI